MSNNHVSGWDSVLEDLFVNSKVAFQKVKQSFPNKCDFHVPEEWVGNELVEGDKMLFKNLKETFDEYLVSSNPQHSQLILCDTVNSPSYIDSITVLLEFFKYIRIKFLAEDIQVIRRSVVSNRIKLAQYSFIIKVSQLLL